jgi:hypothetical protein
MSKMMQRKEIIRNLFLIVCVCILTFIPWASVFGIQDPGLLGAAREIQRTMFFVIVTSMLLKIFYDIYMKPLTQQMKEEEIKETDQKDEKQLLFKPSVGVIIFLISFFAVGTIFGLINPKLGFNYTIIGIGFTVLFTWFWYKQPVFIFAEDSVQIKSDLLYLLGIDRKTVIRYPDITSVSPDAEAEAGLNLCGFDRRHRMVISMNGTIHNYVLVFYNPDIIAKIYLRFREKLGDKVTLE